VTDERLFEFDAVRTHGTVALPLEAALEVTFGDRERGEWRPRLALMEPDEEIWGMSEDGTRLRVRRVSWYSLRPYAGLRREGYRFEDLAAGEPRRAGR
jgi:hypothetical protein